MRLAVSRPSSSLVGRSGSTGTKFNRLGLDSAMLVYLMMELEERLAVDALSRFLADKRAIRTAA
ncbi:hypothetical protein AYJ54_41980 [Bradyrhizobium centrolobii]|uniref:Carrier domain-containing protein n=1 Tax=Bradyrhizobium centrolobii TaxID=1505087 RepID=A0A176Z3G5_9BRAD|nr:hypothetical protein AYJ54_41980 [Bradyrhizobium centrolobii]